MARTFVRVELVGQNLNHEISQRFSIAMGERGFGHTLKGRTSHKALRLPVGLYLIERKTAAEALELTREAAREAAVEARIVCVPAGSGVRFGNLALDDSAPSSPA